MKKRSWKKYLFEFLSIFVAVISAFALNNWNDNRRDNRAESKILTEILNGLEKDQQDVAINKGGHESGIRSCIFWRDIVLGKQANLDSVGQYYWNLTRDFTAIQNTSGYETLKSRGFELIDNDKLRAKIISLYEFDYQSLRKLEEEYYESQFQENYFMRINDMIAPNLIFDIKGNLKSIALPLKLSKTEKNLMLSYLWKIQINRYFIMSSYDEVKMKIEQLIEQIKQEL